MKKKGLFETIVEDLFRGSSENLINEKNDTKYTYAAKQDLRNRFNKYYNDTKKDNVGRTVRNKDVVAARANNIGINLDRGAKRDKYADDMLQKYGSYEGAINSMNPEVKDALDAMKRYHEILSSLEKYGGLEDELKKPDIPDEEREELLKLKADKDKLDNERREITSKYGSSFQRYKDILDKLSLTPAYDQENAENAGIKSAPFGTNYIVNGENGTETSKTKKTGNVTGYDYKNLNLGEVSRDDLVTYFKTGTRADHHFGENTKNPTYSQMAEMAANGDTEAESLLRNLFLKAEFNKILNSKFGYNFRIPTSMYTFGNAKLPDDTLVINFTSAHRCPAWSECLVGYACYARGSEHNYEGLHAKNSNLHLMWESTHEDPELLDSMLRVIKMHIFNPEKMATALLNDNSTREKWINMLNSMEQPVELIDKKYIDKLSNNDSIVDISPFAPKGKKKKNNTEIEEEGITILGKVLNEIGDKPKKLKVPVGAAKMLGAYIYNSKFDEIFDNNDIAVIKNTKSAYRARYIRLNEEGDFIGQWLLDAFDTFAGEIGILGIQTTAYTCRNLNFSAIKNIILNASTLDVGTNGEEDGVVSKSIARRFFAIPSSLYRSLEDTYVENGRELEYKIPKKVKKGDYKGEQPLIPLHNVNGKPSVKYDLKPFTLKGSNEPVTFTDTYSPNGAETKRRMYYKCPCGRHGDILEKGKPIKLNCYLCRMCYEPKDENVGEIYVLVELHGDNIDSFNMEKASAARGIDNTMKTYKEAREIFGNRLSESHHTSEKLGIRMVSSNGINSVKEHLNDIAQGINNKTEMVENKFIDMVNRINEAEKRIK